MRFEIIKYISEMFTSVITKNSVFWGVTSFIPVQLRSRYFLRLLFGPKNGVCSASEMSTYSGRYDVTSQRQYSSLNDLPIVLRFIFSHRDNFIKLEVGGQEVISLLEKQDYNYLHIHGAEPFFRSRQLCSHSKSSQHFKEPEISMPFSQEPSTGSYHGPY
jgi:hypothetical protein